MSKFKVSEVEFLKALEKASMSAKDSYIITISDRDVNKGKKLANITACDGNSQSMVTMIVESEEPFRVVVGVELLTIVKTLALLKKEITFELIDNNIFLRAGTSKVTIGIKEHGMSMDIINLKDETNIIAIKMDSEKFITGIKGAVYPATSLDNTRETLQDVVCLLPTSNGDINHLRLISTNGDTAAAADIEVVECNDSFKKSSETESYYSVSATALSKVSSRLDISKPTKLFITNKQLLISNGNDFYSIRPYERAFPLGIVKIIYNENRNYKLQLAARELKVAIDIAVLNCTDNNKKGVIITLNKKGKVKVTSFYKKNSTELSTISSDGEITIALKADYLKKVIEAIGTENITLSGMSNVEGMYITSESNSSLIGMVLPVNLGKFNEKDEKKEENNEK